MKIRTFLTSGHNKEITHQVVQYVGTDAGRFKELMDCFLSEEMRISQRAGWALGMIGEKHVELLNPYHCILLDCLKRDNAHNAIRRNIVRVYQFCEIPMELEAELYDVCINFISDFHEMIAVKAFSIRVCERIIEHYPELRTELSGVIRSEIEHWSPGLKNRGRKFLERWK